MKADDIKPCAICGKGVAHAGIPILYQVSIQPLGLDRRAIEQVAGLEMMMGNVALARVFSPDPDIAKPIGEPSTVLVCQPCSLEPHPLLALLQE